MNDVLSSWEEMKIEHIRNAIDAQRGVMLEIIEKQGVLLRFSVPTRHVKRERVISLSLESDSVFQINSKPSHFMILRKVQPYSFGDPHRGLPKKGFGGHQSGGGGHQKF